MEDLTLVVGLGNPLMGDDGAGHCVIEQLARLEGHGPRLAACHGDATHLLGLWNGERRVWFVDAMIRGGPPGRIHTIDHDGIMASPAANHSAHDLSLIECLRTMSQVLPAMRGIRYSLWGIEPGTLEAGQPLSPAVRGAVRQVARLVRNAWSEVG